jgi:hypothetical protein
MPMIDVSALAGTEARISSVEMEPGRRNRRQKGMNNKMNTQEFVIMTSDRQNNETGGHILATSHGLPWHRVVRADGTIPQGQRQRELLLAEGVPMRGDRVDLDQARLPPEL